MTMTDDVKLCQCCRCKRRLITKDEMARWGSKKPPADVKSVAGWVREQLRGTASAHFRPACGDCLPFVRADPRGQ